MRLLPRSLGLTAVALLLPTAALADTAIYNAQNLWQSHLYLGQASYITFSGSTELGPTYTTQGFNFGRGPNGSYGIYNDGSYGNTTYLEYEVLKGTSVETITVPSGETAVGLVFGALGGQATFGVDINGVYKGSIEVPGRSSSPYPTSFLGVTSDSGINQITLVSQSPDTDILRVADGFYNPSTGTYGALVPTPEPSSLALLGTGLLGAVGLLRRRLL